MHAPVGYHPAGVVPEPSKARPAIREYAEAICVERNFWRWSEPQIPLQILRRIGIGRVADAIRMLIAEVPRTYMAHLAYLSAPDYFNGFLKVDARALLGSHLDDPIVLSRRFHHSAALIDRQRYGLLNI